MAAEGKIVRQFLIGLDVQGLAPPSEAAFQWRDLGGLFGDLTSPSHKAEWPPPRFAPLFALAQHHGIPTRLLDWSAHPYIAAYFAAIDVCGRSSSGVRSAPNLAVWALLTGRFGAVVLDDPINQKWPQLRLVRPPRHSNPNLHAQEGVFTLLLNPQLGRDAPARFPALDLLLAERLAEGPSRDILPVLRRLELPTALAGELLRRLSSVGVDAIRLFPGMAGVVRGMSERAHWDIDQPHPYE